MKKTTTILRFPFVFAFSLIVAFFNLPTDRLLAADIQNAVWFMSAVYITQGTNTGTHLGTQNFDVVGYNGDNNIKAPFDCKVVAKYTSELEGNTVIIESLNNVRYADGSIEKMSMAFGHDNDISDLYIGKVISQGEVFYQTGTYGQAYGQHSHVTCIRGAYRNDMWTQNAQGNYCSPNAISPTSALFVSSDTPIINSQGMSFVSIQSNHVPQGAVDAVVGGTGTIFVRGWAFDEDAPSAALDVHVYVGDCAREGSTAEKYIIKANKYRSDGGIGYHGFEETIDVGRVGSQRICIYLIDTQIGDNPCKYDGNITIGEGTPQTSGIRTIPDGYYQIVSAINDEYELDVDGDTSFSATPNVQIWKNRTDNKDIFQVKYENGFYEIKHTESGKCLQVAGASKANNANVNAGADNNGVEQRWAIKENGRYWNLESKCSGYRLDAFTGVVYDNKPTNVGVHRANEGEVQKWRFIPYAPETGRTLEDGDYHIVCRAGNEKYGLNVTGTSGDFRNVTAKKNLSDDSQVFSVSYDSRSGSYIIKYKGTQHFLEVENCGEAQNVGVALGRNGQPDGSWKQWVLKKDSSGYYNIVSLKTGECVFYDSANNGNISCALSRVSKTEQQFKFVKVKSTSGTNTPVNPSPNPTPSNPDPSPAPSNPDPSPSAGNSDPAPATDGGNSGGAGSSGGGGGESSEAAVGAEMEASAGSFTTSDGETVSISVKESIPITTIEYTGGKITAKKLEASIDTSNLVSAAEDLILKGNPAKLFKKSWITKGNKNAGTAKFYAKITFDEEKAKSYGMSKSEIKQMKKAVKAINKTFKENPQSVTITPVNISERLSSVSGKFDKNGKLKMKSVKVEINGKVKKLSTKNYKIVSADPTENKVVIAGKGRNFTGEVEIVLD